MTIPAYFLYGFPAYGQYFSPEYYQQISDWTFAHWEPAGLWKTRKTLVRLRDAMPRLVPAPQPHDVRGGTAGAPPPLGTLLGSGRGSGEWMVHHLDLKNPLHTKGQRMSEHKTLAGLVTLLEHYPDAAPPGLPAFLRQWADIMIGRSDNLWDFRKYDDTHWSLPRQMPGVTGGGASWNEPGNLAGFPFAAWSVARTLGTNADDTQRRQRLDEIAVAQFDSLWGRNPLGLHSAWRGPMDYLGVERGWTLKYRPVCAHLHKVRGALCSSAATEHFPFHPEGDFPTS